MLKNAFKKKKINSSILLRKFKNDNFLKKFLWH